MYTEFDPSILGWEMGSGLCTYKHLLRENLHLRFTFWRTISSANAVFVKKLFLEFVDLVFNFFYNQGHVFKMISGQVLDI